MIVKLFVVLLQLQIFAAEVCIPRAQLHFTLVAGTSNASSWLDVALNETSELLTKSLFDKTKLTVIYAYGLNEPISPTIERIANAFILRPDINFLYIDWIDYIGGVLHPDCALEIGVKVGETLARMKTEGFDMTKIHLVGHNSGAHLMGQAGNTSASQSVPISRITGLDPAGPAFFALPPDHRLAKIYPNSSIVAFHLSKADATFVDVIHTDADFSGVENAIGHADFYPNGGSAQSSCSKSKSGTSATTACDSLRAVHYFTESLSKNAGPNTFKAVQCDSYDSFMNGKCNFCNASANANMGFFADPTKSGIFYLQTAEKFSRDELGILYYLPSFI